MCEAKQATMEQRFLADCPYRDLVRSLSSWEDKLVAVLHMVRCREFQDWDPKIQWSKYNRFCEYYNIAYFDLDKECEYPSLFHSLFLFNTIRPGYKK